MTHRPVPIDAWHAYLAEIGEKSVGQCTALPGEPIRAFGHAVADRQVALFLADRQQRVGQLRGPCWKQRGYQRQLSAVDVPHRADIEHEWPFAGPHRAFLRGKARLDQRMIDSGGEDRLSSRRGCLDLDLVKVPLPRRRGLRTPTLERRGAQSAVGMEIALGLLDAAQ